jgi:hypothetical protein
MIRKDRDTYVLSTGREVRASHGLISIADQRGKNYGEDTIDGFEIAEGSHGHLPEMSHAYDFFSGQSPWDEWTPMERAELADFMIEQWTAFKATALLPAKNTHP